MGLLPVDHQRRAVGVGRCWVRNAWGRHSQIPTVFSWQAYAGDPPSTLQLNIFSVLISLFCRYLPSNINCGRIETGQCNWYLGRYISLWSMQWPRRSLILLKNILDQSVTWLPPFSSEKDPTNAAVGTSSQTFQTSQTRELWFIKHPRNRLNSNWSVFSVSRVRMARQLGSLSPP